VPFQITNHTTNVTRQCPPLQTDAGGEFECDANTTDLCSEDEQGHDHERQIKKSEVVEAEAFANGVGNGPFTHRRESTRLFD
jgi:hypothetical protein